MCMCLPHRKDSIGIYIVHRKGSMDTCIGYLKVRSLDAIHMRIVQLKKKKKKIFL